MRKWCGKGNSVANSAKFYIATKNTKFILSFVVYSINSLTFAKVLLHEHARSSLRFFVLGFSPSFRPQKIHAGHLLLLTETLRAAVLF